ncbi:hypothetical protein ACQEVB_05495 [Pseudonocardia sp. CA-107938]|uniref:hypothetical protein n=1 Tax=Pseudonocardia sp. CA-107938 TaxID=3240021 RepID=UPI003D8B8D44
MGVADEWIFAVHATRPDDVGVVEIVFRDERAACAYAADRSTDFGVVAASVTGYLLGELGTRHAVAWFADGAEQPARAPRPGPPGRGIYPNGA